MKSHIVLVPILLLSAACRAPATECASMELCNGVDDDCDTEIDEGCACALGETMPCCDAAGVETCGDFGEGPTWSTCSVRCTVPDGGGEPDAAEPDAAVPEPDAAVPEPDAGVDAGPTCTPVTEVCDGADNDCDEAIDEGVTVACVPDADGDIRAGAGTAMNVCPDPSRPAAGNCPPTTVAPASSLGADCNDVNGAVYRLLSVRSDADGDGYCTGSAANQCAGASAPAGTRATAACAVTDDCNDGSASAYVSTLVRADADGDGYCFGAPYAQCGGGTALAGSRVPAACDASDDCRDGNPLAGTTCVLDGAYTTQGATKACFLVPPTESFTVSTTNICPLGYTLSSYGAVRTAGAGTCTATSQTSLSMTCNGLDGATCHIAGVCVAL